MTNKLASSLIAIRGDLMSASISHHERIRKEISIYEGTAYQREQVIGRNRIRIIESVLELFLRCS